MVAQAGIAAMKGKPPLQAWTDCVDTILLGTINAIHAALPYLPDGASIIATGSTAAYMNALPQMQLGTDPGGTAYMYAKRALSEYIHELARNLAPRMIRANAVHPTNCNTDMLQSEPMYQSFRPDLEHPTRRTPPRRSTSSRLAHPVDRAGRHQQHGAVPGLRGIPVRHRHADAGGRRGLPQVVRLATRSKARVSTRERARA